jgi:hypothetical protein
MPLFLRRREKKGKERVKVTKKCTEFRFILFIISENISSKDRDMNGMILELGVEK